MLVLEASHCIWTFMFGSNRRRPGVVERISLTLLKACSCSVFHANGTSTFSWLLIGAVTVDISGMTWQIVQHSYQTLNVFLALWFSHIDDCFKLGWLHSVGTDYVAHVAHFRFLELQCRDVELHVFLLGSLEQLDEYAISFFFAVGRIDYVVCNHVHIINATKCLVHSLL